MKRTKLSDIIKELRTGAHATPDTIYRYISASENLFCIAFFGHKGTKQQRARLNYIWKQIIKTV